ncbi:MAG: ROK family protein [Clostridia bacterium]|nr:ROK family protein [Clostridia bacterium]
MKNNYITQDKLKNTTLADIFAFILEKKETTRREIERETGFSWGTVSANVSLLIEKGYINEKKSSKNVSFGRKTGIISLSSAGVASIGIDVNRSGISCVVVALDSHVFYKFDDEFYAQTQCDVIKQAESICRTAVDWCERNNIKVFSLGIAVQGSVNGRAGLSVRFPGISDWKPFNIKDHFVKTFNIPVYIGHDPKCMLLGEMARQKHDNCVLVRIDEGIGMAVSLDSKILDDNEKFELGHTIVVPEGRICRCGKKGCLEAYASLRAITGKEYNDDLQEISSLYEPEIVEAGNCLAVSLYNVYTLFRPQKIILTGKATRLGLLTEKAVSLLPNDDLIIDIRPDVSAAYGASIESVKYANDSFII